MTVVKQVDLVFVMKGKDFTIKNGTEVIKNCMTSVSGECPV